MWAILAKLAALFSGPLGWVGRLALEWLWTKGLKAMQEAYANWRRAKAQKAAAEKLNAKPEATREEKRQDEEDYLNS